MRVAGRGPVPTVRASAIAPLPPPSLKREGEGGEEDLYAELTLEDILVVEDARELVINSQKSMPQYICNIKSLYRGLMRIGGRERELVINSRKYSLQ